MYSHYWYYEKLFITHIIERDIDKISVMFIGSAQSNIVQNLWVLESNFPLLSWRLCYVTHLISYYRVNDPTFARFVGLSRNTTATHTINVPMFTARSSIRSFIAWSQSFRTKLNTRKATRLLYSFERLMFLGRLSQFSLPRIEKC